MTEQVSQPREEGKEALLCIEESMLSARKAKPTPGSVGLMDKTAAAHQEPYCVCTKNSSQGFGSGSTPSGQSGCATQPDGGAGFGITWFEQPAATKTIGLGKGGVKLSKAVDSEAAVTYPLTRETIAELEPKVTLHRLPREACECWNPAS
jgi:hypothetical protein